MKPKADLISSVYDVNNVGPGLYNIEIEPIPLVCECIGFPGDVGRVVFDRQKSLGKLLSTAEGANDRKVLQVQTTESTLNICASDKIQVYLDNTAREIGKKTRALYCLAFAVIGHVAPKIKLNPIPIDVHKESFSLIGRSSDLFEPSLLSEVDLLIRHLASQKTHIKCYDHQNCLEGYETDNLQEIELILSSEGKTSPKVSVLGQKCLFITNPEEADVGPFEISFSETLANQNEFLINLRVLENWQFWYGDQALLRTKNINLEGLGLKQLV